MMPLFCFLLYFVLDARSQIVISPFVSTPSVYYDGRVNVTGPMAWASADYYQSISKFTQLSPIIDPLSYSFACSFVLESTGVNGKHTKCLVFWTRLDTSESAQINLLPSNASTPTKPYERISTTTSATINDDWITFVGVERGVSEYEAVLDILSISAMYEEEGWMTQVTTLFSYENPTPYETIYYKDGTIAGTDTRPLRESSVVRQMEDPIFVPLCLHTHAQDKALFALVLQGGPELAQWSTKLIKYSLGVPYDILWAVIISPLVMNPSLEDISADVGLLWVDTSPSGRYIGVFIKILDWVPFAKQNKISIECTAGSDGIFVFILYNNNNGSIAGVTCLDFMPHDFDVVVEGAIYTLSTTGSASRLKSEVSFSRYQWNGNDMATVFIQKIFTKTYSVGERNRQSSGDAVIHITPTTTLIIGEDNWDRTLTGITAFPQIFLSIVQYDPSSNKNKNYDIQIPISDRADTPKYFRKALEYSPDFPQFFLVCNVNGPITHSTDRQQQSGIYLISINFSGNLSPPLPEPAPANSPVNQVSPVPGLISTVLPIWAAVLVVIAFGLVLMTITWVYCRNTTPETLYNKYSLVEWNDEE